MARRLNVVWIVIDSVRHYRDENRDARDKLEIMDKLAPSMIEFGTTVTSAPSSVMSIGTMMTGIPSYYLGRDYDTFYFDYRSFDPLPEILRRELGYNTYAILAFIDAREAMGRMLGLVDRRLWPKGVTYSRRVWTNDEINGILGNLLDEGLNEPFFLYLHYNSRQDFATSEKVEWGLEQLRQRGYYDPDNTIFIMCSDHGYPDPRRGIDEDWFVANNMTHDLLLTDDNIRIPLLLGYPGCSPRRVDTMVQTMDLLPTVLDLVGLGDRPCAHHKADYRGRSLVPLTVGPSSDGPDTGSPGAGNPEAAALGDRLVRSDARFMWQSFRRTAIRGQRYKYVRSHDEGKEEFFDLVEDPLEERNIIDRPDLSGEIEQYRQEFFKQERDAVAFHFKVIAGRVREAMGSTDGGGEPAAILVVANPEGRHLQSLLEVINEVMEDCTTDVWTIDQEAPRGRRRYDVVMTLLDGTAADIRKRTIKAVKQYRAGRLIHVSANFDIDIAASRDLLFYLKYAYSRRRLYLQEPSLLWRNVSRKVKYSFDRLFGRA